MPRQVVWIAEGCIRCCWCQHLEPRVFHVSDRGSLILAAARSDGRTDSNAVAQAPLRSGLLDEESARYLRFIADGCPVRVIHLGDERDGGAAGDRSDRPAVRGAVPATGASAATATLRGSRRRRR